MAKRDDTLYVLDLASVFSFSLILFTIFTKKFLASHVSQSFPASLNEFDIKSFANRPADMAFYCSQISFENANNTKDKKMRSTSSHKFPQYIIYLSTKIKAPREREIPAFLLGVSHRYNNASDQHFNHDEKK